MLTSTLQGLIVAMVTAFVTVWLALRRFYSEQWWSRKAEAYVEVLGALFKAKSYAAERLMQNMSAMALTPDEENRLLERARQGYDELFRATAVSAVFLPEEAQKELESVLPMIKNSWLPDSYDVLEPAVSAIDKCVTAIRELAKKELKKA
jgi:hypothetical protein